MVDDGCANDYIKTIFIIRDKTTSQDECVDTIANMI